MDDVRGEGTNGVAEAIHNLDEGGKGVVAKATPPDPNPDLLNGVHLRRGGGKVDQADVVRNDQPVRAVSGRGSSEKLVYRNNVMCHGKIKKSEGDGGRYMQQRVTGHFFPEMYLVTQRKGDDTEYVFELFSISKSASCPCCGIESTRSHGYQDRAVRDLPILGKSVTLLISQMKCYCENEECAVDIFTEQNDLANQYSYAESVGQISFPTGFSYTIMLSCVSP